MSVCMSLIYPIVEQKHFHLQQSHTFTHIRSPSVPNGWDLALGRDVLHQYQLNNTIELDVFPPVRRSLWARPAFRMNLNSDYKIHLLT